MGVQEDATTSRIIVKKGKEEDEKSAVWRDTSHLWEFVPTFAVTMIKEKKEEQLDTILLKAFYIENQKRWKSSMAWHTSKHLFLHLQSQW